MSEVIRDWLPSDPPGASRLNALASTVRSVQFINSSGIATVTQSETGTAITVPTRDTHISHYLGTIVNAGPTGEADFTIDKVCASYWVQISAIFGNGAPFKLTPLPASPGYPTILAVANIAEVNTKTRNLAVDGSVLVHVFEYADTDPQLRYVIDVPGLRPGILFRVNLSNPTGSNGTKTTAATYVYDVADLNSKSLGTAMPVERSRPLGTVTTATKGVGYYNTSGTLVLAEAWENPGLGGC